MNDHHKTAIVAGLGPGLASALCRQLVIEGYQVAGLSRGNAPLDARMEDLGSDHFMQVRCDITDPEQVDDAITQVEARFGQACMYIHNASYLHMAPFIDTAPDQFESLWRTTCLGAVHGAQRVLPGMLDDESGTLLFIGATASIKAAANFSAFGSAKFAIRGLAQSLARELGPRGIHVAHLLIDGVIWSERARDHFGMTESQCLDPVAIAQTCVALIEQDRSAWTFELDIRPYTESF